MRQLVALAATLTAATTGAMQTVCTVTVNSADEREAFQRHLPATEYRFVELAQLGQRDWLGKACRERVQCDVLLVSGHFAGTDFYSSKHGEHLPVDEIERVTCSDSCPDLFSSLKEVYLFGCDTLKSEPVKSGTPEIVRSLIADGRAPGEAAAIARALSERYAESARDRMRRAFPGVPVIYGFSSLAPYGRVAGPMLRGYFESGGAEEVGRGEPSRKLLRLFGLASMISTPGQRPSDADAEYRAEACRYHDDRITTAQRLAFMRDILAGDVATLRMSFDRIERFIGALPIEAVALANDAPARDKYLEATRATGDPALRVRMISLARRIGWLDAAAERTELAAMIGQMLAAGSNGYHEVDLICGLADDRRFAEELARFDVARLSRSPGNAAALACMGSAVSRQRVLRAMASADEGEVRVAQAYLRHRPIAEASELRALVREIARMKASSAQARALEVVARQRVSDPQASEELSLLFARTGSLAVQRAIAEVFLRDPRPAAPTELARYIRQHRIKAGGASDLIDALIQRLES